MRKNIFFNIGDIIVGTIVGYLVYRFSGEHDFTIGLSSIATGILTIIMLEVIFHPYIERKEFNELGNRINYLTDKISDRLMSNADLAAILKYGHVRIPAGKFTDVWVDRLWQTHHRYGGIIYTSPNQVTNTTVFQPGLSIMSAEVRVDQVDIKRFFLFETEESLESSKQAMLACHQHHVRYLFRKQIELNPLLHERTKHLPTLDFTIFDSHIMWLLMLDKNRHIQHGELFFDGKMNEQYSKIFRLMWDGATSFHE
jgi:hypothetical protein